MTQCSRILITGMTANHVGNGTYQIMSLCDRLKVALEQMGYEVDQRPVTPGEDLSMYRGAFIAIYEPRSVTTGVHRYGAMWAAINLPHVVLFDDFNLKIIVSGLKYVTRNVKEGKLERSFWRVGLHAGGSVCEKRATAFKHQKRIDALIEQWSKSIPCAMMCAFEWGDRSIFHALHSFGELHFFDPTLFVPKPDTKCVKPFGLRDKQWVIASLHNYDQWIEKLGPSWPVWKQYKPKGAKPDPGKNLARKWDKMKEHEVVQLYGRSVGVLSPPYPISGSGWWRSRFVHAANTRTIVWADPREVNPLGPGNPYLTRLDYIEEMNPRQLVALAHDQRECLFNNVASTTRTFHKLEKLINRRFH